MLSLSTLYATLNQILVPPSLHTAILFTTSGQLISYASNFNSSSSCQGDSESDTGPTSEYGDLCPRPKDDIRVLVGLGCELWGETKHEGIGMVDSELGRLVVVAIMPRPSSASQVTPDPPAVPTTSKASATDRGAKASDTGSVPPLMLLALNGTDEVSWDELRTKTKALASHLAVPLSKYRQFLTVAPPPPPPTTAPPSHVTSPAPGR